MNINTFKTFAAAALVLVAFTTGCKKDDVTKPVITVTGANPMTLNVGSAYTEAGATATDDVDGDLTDAIATTGTVDITVAGTNTITYSVADAAGNTATATRTVNVVMSRDAILGNYTTTNTCTSFPSNTVATTTAFQTNAAGDKFVINLFYYNGGTLTCTLSGSSVTVDAGQAPGPTAYGITGSGTFSANGKVLTMNYTFTPGSGAAQSCSVTYTKP